MSKFDDLLSSRGLTFFAVLVITHATLSAQDSLKVPKPASSQSRMQSFSSPPSSTPQAPSQTALPSPVPETTASQSVVPLNPKATPEEIGDSLSMRQRYQEAIEAYSKSPEHSAALWNKMGIAYQMLFDLKDATRCYQASLKMDSHNSRVLNNLATVYDSQKQYGKAERYYRKALKNDPRSALVLRNLGSNLLSQHKYKKGAEAYRAALEIDPNIMEQHTVASVPTPTSARERGALHYYMAEGCVSAGNSECAISNLRLALNEGFTSAKKIAEDSVFSNLRDKAAFQQLIASQAHQ